ncbi:MAG: hypothetical protein FJW95_02160 [Actinobacteria bacterium]|nr:hypothetical protein [Actinomycetota bacterium]
MADSVHRPPAVGHAIIALHDPVRGREAAFNAWYEADHMLAAGTMAPWTIGGMRWVADRDLKALRYPADGPFGPATRGSFMMLFWIQRDRLAEQQAWVTEAMADIAVQDRNFADREAVTATTYDFSRSVSRETDGVPPVLALAHHFPGAVLLVVERTADGSVAALGDWLLDTYLAPRLAGSPVALVTAFAPRPKEAWWPAAYPEVEGVGERLFVVCFTDTDPRECWATHFAPLGDALAASGTGRVLLAAPFVPAPVGRTTTPESLW